MSHRLTLPVLAGTATLLALSGAFGTDQHLRLVPRLLYWGVLIVMTYSVGLLCSSVLEHLARDRLSAFMRILLAGAMTGLGVTACVITLNLGFFAFLPRGAEFFRF
ncbi:MAG: hypothetical protein ACPGVS_09940, partial [Primorskyibacter sp.]